MTTVTSPDGTVIGFERNGSGPALVMVDPASCFRGFGPIQAHAAELANHFTVYTYDRRGRGESTDTLPYSVDREVADLQAVITAAGGSAYVFGYSSGAVLALHAAAQNLPIRKLALFEPSLDLEQPAPEDDEFASMVADLVKNGRRADAIEYFHSAIGVPPEMLTGLKQSPAWPALESLAHTLSYDIEIASTPPHLPGITVPTLVISSEASDPRLRAWAEGVADALPDATHKALPGEWHGVPADVLAPALTAFL